MITGMGNHSARTETCAIGTVITTAQEPSKLAQAVTGDVRFQYWLYSCLRGRNLSQFSSFVPGKSAILHQSTLRPLPLLSCLAH
jgi:hypothetical protein